MPYDDGARTIFLYTWGELGVYLTVQLTLFAKPHLRCFLAALQLTLLINGRLSHSLQRELIHASMIISRCRLWLNC